MENTVTVVHPNVHHNNWGIQLRSDPKTVRRFDRICHREFCAFRIDDPRYKEKKAWGAFHQGSSADWSYWEFWMAQTPENEAKVRTVVEQINQELHTPDPDAEFWGDE